jgi:hypothetical protein
MPRNRTTKTNAALRQTLSQAERSSRKKHYDRAPALYATRSSCISAPSDSTHTVLDESEEGRVRQGDKSRVLSIRTPYAAVHATQVAARPWYLNMPGVDVTNLTFAVRTTSGTTADIVVAAHPDSKARTLMHQCRRHFGCRQVRLVSPQGEVLAAGRKLRPWTQEPGQFLRLVILH